MFQPFAYIKIDYIDFPWQKITEQYQYACL